VPSDGTTQEAYQYTSIVKADNVDETWPKRQSVDIKPKRQNSPRGKIAQEAKHPKWKKYPKWKKQPKWQKQPQVAKAAQVAK
jgi:hypothetical protein